MKLLLIISTALIGISISGFSQTQLQETDIRLIEKNYQSCLDKGTNMLGCAQRFYRDMDSCLNTAYKQLREKLNEPSKAALKKEQLAWLKARDLKFQQIDKTNKDEGRDGAMFRHDEKARFVKDRVITLIGRSTHKEEFTKLDSIEKANSESVAASGDNITKAFVFLKRGDSTIHLTANIKRDYRIFGYAKPDVSSERILLLSVFTDDVQQNPFGCELGAYYDTSGMKESTLKYVSTTGAFVKALSTDRTNKSTEVYFEKKWIAFE